jgi:hypothetical protein
VALEILNRDGRQAGGAGGRDRSLGIGGIFDPSDYGEIARTGGGGERTGGLLLERVFRQSGRPAQDQAIEGEPLRTSRDAGS